MRLILFIMFMVLYTSCAEESPSAFTSVTIHRVYTDSLSIRAIAPVDAHNVWFAANQGRIGLINDTIPKLATITYDDALVEFRAIAVTPSSAFVMSIGNPGVLYKIGYDKTEATNIEEVYVEKHEKVFYDAMAFWNDQEGIAMGDPTEDCLSIIVTRDGGASWKKISCEYLPKTEAGEAAFAASNSNIAIYEDHTWIVTGGKRARVFYSPNKGESWEVYTTPMIQGQAMTGIYTVDFYDENNGIIFGGNWDQQEFNEGNKAVTTDGGKTWNLISNGAGPGYRSSVRYVPGTKGMGIVAVGMPGMSYSADGGSQWTELSDEGFYAIEFVNDSIAFASGRSKISRLIFK